MSEKWKSTNVQQSLLFEIAECVAAELIRTKNNLFSSLSAWKTHLDFSFLESTRFRLVILEFPFPFSISLTAGDPDLEELWELFSLQES